MVKTLKLIWHYFLKAGLIIGNFITCSVLFIIYYTIFLAFALPFRLFSNPLSQKVKGSNWRVKKTTPKKLEDFINE